jgi:acyl-CoA synthetase (AMP-forming)/AMP-acid ligase II
VTHFAQHLSTLAHELADRACRHGDRTAVRFTSGDQQWSSLNYAGLAGSAAAVAELLRAAPRPDGRPQFVVVMLPNGLDYVRSLYGCLIAGAVAIPFYPPSVLTSRTARTFGERLRQICLDCRPSVIIAPSELVDLVRRAVPATPLVLAADELPEADPTGIARIDARPNDLALLQYTSGSTMAPKGVMVTHANLVHNTHAFGAAVGAGEGESLASWLPLFHDLGLIGTLLLPLAAGMTVHMTTPMAFVRRPYLWLDIASKSRASVIMAPNFAYDLCVRAVSEEQRSTLDLSGIRAAINGAEPVRHTTIDAFVKAYQRCGFRPTAMMPAYGLAEATACVTSPGWAHEPMIREVSAARLRQDGIAVPADCEPVALLTSCGAALADMETVIVDPDRLEPCPPGSVGELWLTGPSVAGGYWNQPEASERTFAAELAHDGRQFLRTGDLAVEIDEEVYLVGRIKDMIIQDGVNHSPQDVESTVERADPALRPAGSVVFTVMDEGAERVVILCELDQYSDSAGYPAILARVRAAVAEEHGLAVAIVALVRKGQVPKTTSGKVRRGASADRWLAGTFDVLAASPGAQQRADGFGPGGSVSSTSYAPATHSHSNGRVSAGSMTSSTRNASAVRNGERTPSSPAASRALSSAASAPASSSRRRNATSRPPSIGSDPQSPDGQATRQPYR